MKLIWDILAAGVFFFVWYKVVVILGAVIPGFGYFIGFVVGVPIATVCAGLVYVPEYLFRKLFRMSTDIE